MIYTKENPIGLDAKIQGIQTRLYARLIDLWGLDENTFDAYGRVYVKRKTNKVLPEAYIGRNEYQNVLVAEKNKFFFVARNTINAINAIQFQTTIELCFILDLSQIKSDIGHRADQEVQLDVKESFRGVDNVNIVSLVTEPNQVFSGFTFNETDNLHPYHVFKYNLNVIYFEDEVCKCKC